MMKYKAIFLYFATQDLKEIKKHLNREASPEIRKAFVEQLTKQIKTTEDYPGINAVYPDNLQYRRLVVHNYPYCAYYKTNDENSTIDIYRVLHTSRDVERLIK